MLSVAVLFSIVSAGVQISAASTKRDFVIFEAHRAPPTFTKVSPAPSSHLVNLQIGLKQPSISLLEASLWDSSDPDSARYGVHLTDEEVEAFSAPRSESIDAVGTWLKEHGLSGEWSKASDWVTIPSVPVSKVEEMLDARYGVYRHADGDAIVRTEAWSLPAYLHQHIDLVQPTTMFGRLHRDTSDVARIEFLDRFELKELAAHGTSSACTNASSVSNHCLRQLYGTFNYTPVSTRSSMVGVTGYLGEASNYRDLASFLAIERPDQPDYRFKFRSVAGGKNPQNLNSTQLQNYVGVEANLDVQTVAGFTAPAQSIFYSTPGSPPFKPDAGAPTNTNEPYLVWLQYILSVPSKNLPKVITTSYGDDEQTVPKSYAVRACLGFAQLGAKGVSVIFSSGDSGVGRDASCPYVTAVGATQNFSPEEAVSNEGPGGFTSGGGFSNYFRQPSYQRHDVAIYLKALGKTHKGLYNPKGRAYPDVSAQGARYLIAWQDRFVHVGGTSASSPTFASIIALLNDYRISKGKPSLGFLNPWLYSKGRRGLTDIRIGSSAGCDTTGFAASKGWDPVTGLGTPRFQTLQTLV